MGGFGRVLAIVVAVLIAVAIGAGVYNAGVSAGLAEAAQQAAAAGDPLPVPTGYGYGWGYGPYWHGPGGFGFFGIFFAILGIFLIIGLVRASFGWGRWRGGGPNGGSGRRERLEEFHRELHRRDSSAERPAGA